MAYIRKLRGSQNGLGQVKRKTKVKTLITAPKVKPVITAPVVETAEPVFDPYAQAKADRDLGAVLRLIEDNVAPPSFNYVNWLSDDDWLFIGRYVFRQYGVGSEQFNLFQYLSEQRRSVPTVTVSDVAEMPALPIDFLVGGSESKIVTLKPAISKPTVTTTPSSADILAEAGTVTTTPSSADILAEAGGEMPTVLDVAQAQINPWVKWGLLGLGAYIFLSSLSKSQPPPRRRRRRRPRRR